MSKQFSEMTAVELREYAEMVQAEYDADEISGPSGRQIVRDAWERVEAAERAAAERAEVVEAPAPAPAPAADRIVEDVDTSYDDDAIDEALDAIRDAVRDGRPYARLIEEAHGLGCSRYAISDVIREAQAEVEA